MSEENNNKKRGPLEPGIDATLVFVQPDNIDEEKYLNHGSHGCVNSLKDTDNK